MPGLGKTGTVRGSASVSPARSQEIYRHYAAALYRQALLNTGDPAPAGDVACDVLVNECALAAIPGQRRAGIHPREMAALLRVILRRLTTPPPAAEDRDQV
jgi:hypothetical protein